MTTQLIVPAHTFPVGVTRQVKALPAGTINNYSLSADASPWVNPATLTVLIESSFDGGVTYQLTDSFGESAPPPWQGDNGPVSVLTSSDNYEVGRQPDHIALTVTVTGNPIPLGQTTVTVS